MRPEFDIDAMRKKTLEAPKWAHFGADNIFRAFWLRRRSGVGSYLVEDARKYFASIGLKDMRFDVWLSSPRCLPLARKCGFKKGEMIKLYPKLEL